MNLSIRLNISSVGVRYPTSVGYLLIAPLLFALGLPGEVDAEWASGTSGKALYITILTCIGVVNNLINATGAIECARKWPPPNPQPHPKATLTVISGRRGAGERRSGHLRPQRWIFASLLHSGGGVYHGHAYWTRTCRFTDQHGRVQRHDHGAGYVSNPLAWVEGCANNTNYIRSCPCARRLRRRLCSAGPTTEPVQLLRGWRRPSRG